MQPVQRIAAQSARRVRPQLQRQCRRNASDSHGVHPPEHAPPKDSSHSAHQSANESFGRGFFITLAAIPATIAIIQYTREGSTPYFTRLIKDTYDEWKTKWAQNNDLHTQMVEQAAADRVLFLNESSRPLPDLRFPEQFNTGSPWNVPAGHGRVNIDKVIEKYQKEAFEEQEKKLQQLRENKIPAEQPVERLVKRAPSPSN